MQIAEDDELERALRVFANSVVNGRTLGVNAAWDHGAEESNVPKP